MKKSHKVIYFIGFLEQDILWYTITMKAIVISRQVLNEHGNFIRIVCHYEVAINDKM
jgi:hypothetical protein